MRFIGNKQNIVEKIYSFINTNNIQVNSFFDLFAGTSSVGKFFKKQGFEVYSSDLLYFSYVLQRAYIQNNSIPQFNSLLKELKFHSTSLYSTPLDLVIEFLNTNINLINDGFIYKNYTNGGTLNNDIQRMYFNDENGQIIDSIRQTIEIWKEDNLISDDEYYILIACLIETVSFYANISGVYSAFHKKWDSRALKKLILRPIEIIVNDKFNQSFNKNSLEIINKVSANIIYLDPPYNHRQYAPNYHILETIAKYDNPIIKGIAGLRGYENQKSNFCNKENAYIELEQIAKNAKYSTLVLSYNNEGLMNSSIILDILNKYGAVNLIEFDYLRFKSNNNGINQNKKTIKEQLYILNKYEK